MRRFAFLALLTEAVQIQTKLDYTGYENDGEKIIWEGNNEWYRFKSSMYTGLQFVDHKNNNGRGIADGTFWLTHKTGQCEGQECMFYWIHARKNLDREEQAKYEFYIKLTSPDGTVEEADDIFTYTVADVNDNAPYISESSFNHIIREDTAVNQDFPSDSPFPHNGIIEIIDDDDKKSASNKFKIQIENKSSQIIRKWDGTEQQFTDQEIFRFENVDDEFRKKMVLNTKLRDIENIKSISFDVTISDCDDLSSTEAQTVCSAKGRVMKSDPITINVKVSDVNTEKPVIYVDDDGVPKSMEENTAPDRTIFSVYAEDNDRDVINKVTKFSVVSCLSSTSSQSETGCRYFEAKQIELCNNAKECEEQAENIDQFNRAEIVTTASAVDYESLQEHDDHPGQKGLMVVVEAVNHVALDEKKSRKEIWVTVRDINEAPKLLSRNPGDLHVLENLQNEKVKGGCIESEDPEDDEVGYTIINGDEYFTIDDKGCLRTTVNEETSDWIDREEHALHETTSTGDKFIKISIQAYEKRNDAQTALTSEVKEFDILIDDENDNGPELPSVLRTCRTLKKENNYHMVDLGETDQDNCHAPHNNCGPYTFQRQVLDQSGNSHPKLDQLEIVNTNGRWAIHFVAEFAEGEDSYVIEGDGDTGHKIQIIGSDGDKKTTVVNNVQLNICDCPADSNGTAYCNVNDAIIGPAKGGFPWWAGLIIGLVCLLLIIATLVTTRSRGVKSDIEEKPFLDYEDDITEGLGFDEKIGINPLPKDDYYIEPRNEQRGVAVTVIPDQQVYAARPDGILPRDKGLLEKDFLRDAKIGADNDPTAPPYDSLLFDYEGQNSDCDLDSLYSGSDYGDHRLDQLDNEFRSIGALYKGQDTEDPYIL